MKIEMIPINEIIPYWNNLRSPEAAVDAVTQSIISFGMNQPITLDKEKVIITGHTRRLALMSLGWTKAPCVILDLSPEKARAYRIADNKTNELATWNMEVLIPELRELPNLNEMQSYFPGVNLSALLAETSAARTYTDEEIERESGAMKRQFLDVAESATESYSEVRCPHCGGTFTVDRKEIARTAGQDTPLPSTALPV